MRRGHPYDPDLGHGFIDSQRRGMEVFRGIDPETPLVAAEAVWQYSHHVLPGSTTHRGPILTVANWSGQWPGLVGMLNLNGRCADPVSCAAAPFRPLSRPWTKYRLVSYGAVCG